MQKLIFIMIAAGTVATSYWLSGIYFAKDPAEAQFDIPKKPVPVESAAAERRPLRETIVYPGSVAADETVSIAPRISGIIRDIHVDFGDFVTAGDPLVTIDDAEFVERQKQAQATVRLAEAQLKKSEARLEFMRRDFERAQQEAAAGVAMLQELDTKRAARDSAAADVEVSGAQLERTIAGLEEAQLNVADTRIMSPLSGWIQERVTDPGALASPAAPILTIVDIDPAQVVVYVPEREHRLADKGRSATVTTRTNEVFEGRISRVAPSLSMSTRTTELVVEVPNPDYDLRPGMSADVTLIAREAANALAIPLAAVVFQQGNTFAFLIEDGLAHLLPIEIGIEEEEYVEVIRGLDEGDRVVVQGQYLLKDGEPVTEGAPGEGTPQSGLLDS